MNEQEKVLARQLFRGKICKANGQTFEDIFTQIMGYAEPDFIQIKPWGNIGDRKNDGYIKSRGIFFQVFAPEEVRKSYNNVINKLKKDFNGLIQQWKPVNEYYFVVNDKYKGVNADCEKTIQQIKTQHNLNKAGFKIAKDLEDILFKLSDNQILTITGFLPDPSKVTRLGYHTLDEVVGHIMRLSLQDVTDSSIVCPDWDDKINFNELNGLCAQYLSNGFLQVRDLDTYLNNESNFFAETLKEKVRSIYVAKKEIATGSKLFLEIINEISPREESMYRTAAIVIMAKYFETCDIFEEPQK